MQMCCCFKFVAKKVLHNNKLFLYSVSLFQLSFFILYLKKNRSEKNLGFLKCPVKISININIICITPLEHIK